MSRTDNVYKTALEGKNIPILTLDNKWHQLFLGMEKDEVLKHLNKENVYQTEFGTKGKGLNEITKKKIVLEMI